ncbi:MAG TPA: CPBP family glutamic-type intramembrane protease [Actinomycetes bacterium]
MDGPGAEDQHALEPWTAKRAYGLILLLYIVGFGYALASALAYLHEPGHTTGRVGATGALVSTALVLSTDVAVLALVYFIAKARGLSAVDLGLGRPADKAATWRDIDIVLLYWLALLTAGLLSTWLDGSRYPYEHGTWAALPSLALALNAGPTEELALLVLPVVLLRQAREPLWRMAIVLVVLRLSFHVYYGLGVLGLTVWAVAILALYLRTGRALPLIVAHSAYDVLLTVGHFFPATSVLVGLFVLCVLILGLVRIGVRARAGGRHRRGVMAPSTGPAAGTPGVRGA